MNLKNTGKPLAMAAFESSIPTPQPPPATDTPPRHPPVDWVMRRREVERATGLTRSALYRLMALDAFPAQIRISAKAVGWLSSEVYAWIASRAAARD